MDDKTNIKFRSNQHSIKIVGLWVIILGLW
jgi:hypothetical protein